MELRRHYGKLVIHLAGGAAHQVPSFINNINVASAYLILNWSFCFANPLISLRVTRVTLFFKLHDYAFSAMVTLEGIVLRNNHPDRLRVRPSKERFWACEQSLE